MRTILSLITLCLVQTATAQFAPQAGVAGTTAISKTSGKFTGWATGCALQRGWTDINDKSQGYVTSGDSSWAIGIADAVPVSIGDSGVATLTFAKPLYDGAGPDFAVFENAFPNPQDPEMAFLELAFVEVSSDGVNFFRFPAICNAPTSPQVPGAGVYMNARLINNLAGKYLGGYGVPFDLQELTGTSGLDINSITHVRLVDVVGSTGGHASYDSEGNVINEPYPTPFPTGGFDLDAVGAFYQHGLFPMGIGTPGVQKNYVVYPNPATDRLVLTSDEPMQAMLTDISGKQLTTISLTSGAAEIFLDSYTKGIYLVVLSDSKGNKWVEKITKL
ncbi:T9SS type A sorting domain-containing protein [Polluticoccus soli]|uniref:T9SS type A sorting domain-containing protein n=1 Tax=Polluticoccus soli TaxID=3034150 RepID=UPI0023E22ADA|nr:T9SS type A sorting domain-containing protein [Flavipsychrobacter sp. JY13-12]